MAMDGKYILSTTTAGSLFPYERNNIVSVSRTDTVSLAFQRMVTNKVLSVPVYDRTKRCFTCFLDIIDVVAFSVKQFTEPREPKELPTNLDVPLFESATCGEVSDISKRNPFCPVESSAPLMEAINLMVKWCVHRIPIVDSEGELITILSQSQVSAFLYKYIRSFNPSLFNETAASIAATANIKGDTNEELLSGDKDSNGSDKNESIQKKTGVISVGLKDRAIDAFKLMHEKKVSGVAVVDEEGKIVGNLSASDLKTIGYDGTLVARLYYPVSEYLKLIHFNTNSEDSTSPLPPPLVVKRDTPFLTVMGTLVNSRIHRVYVVDEEQHPVGVIGHGEILRAVQTSLMHTTHSYKATFAYI